MVSRQALLRSNRTIDEPPEHLSWHADDALVFTDTDAELDGVPVSAPSRVLGEAEEHGMPPLRTGLDVPIMFDPCVRLQVDDFGVYQRLYTRSGTAANVQTSDCSPETANRRRRRSADLDRAAAYPAGRRGARRRRL